LVEVNVDKTLTRKLFQKTKHDHRSSGITSGLKYRPGYAKGGRVGFQAGGLGYNPNVSMTDGQLRSTNPIQMMEPGIPDPFARRFSAAPASIESLQDTGVEKSAQKAAIAKEMQKYKDAVGSVDYDRYKREGMDIYSDAAYDFLEKRNKPIPAGTIGAPSQYLDLLTSLGSARKSARERNEELDLLSQMQDVERDKTQYDMAYKELQKSKEVDADKAAATTKFLRQLEAMKVDSQYAIDLANANPPAKIQEIDRQMEEGKTFEEATAIVYGTKDDQDALFQNFLKIYSVDPNGLPVDADVAFQQAMDALNRYLGKENIKINDPVVEGSGADLDEQGNAPDLEKEDKDSGFDQI
tara:strand:+ start:2049 stop:3107 length:1059 start_codon:yes stop_codon:yes gene_type:complete